MTLVNQWQIISPWYFLISQSTHQFIHFTSISWGTLVKVLNSERTSKNTQRTPAFRELRIKENLGPLYSCRCTLRILLFRHFGVFNFPGECGKVRILWGQWEWYELKSSGWFVRNSYQGFCTFHQNNRDLSWYMDLELWKVNSQTDFHWWDPPHIFIDFSTISILKYHQLHVGLPPAVSGWVSLFNCCLYFLLLLC